MSTLPLLTYLNTARTEGELKTGFYGPQLDVIAELLGGAESISTLTISSGSVTPTAATHLIDTEGAASTDDLTNIVVTNMPEARFLVIRIVDSAREVVLKHEAGGSGQISLINNNDLTLNNTKQWVTLIRYGTTWYETNKSLSNTYLSIKESKTADYSVSQNDEFKLLSLSSSVTANKTFTLPAMTSLNDGFIIGFINDSDYNLIVEPDSTDSIWTASTGQSIESSVKGSVCILRYNYSALTWDIINNTANDWHKENLKFSGPGASLINKLVVSNWTTRTSAADNNWQSICWSPSLGLFCAVSNLGTGTRVQTSPDGINWTTQTSASDNDWRGVCWSPDLSLFCAVATSGTGDRIMTSSNGTSWSTQTNPDDNNWQSVCWSPELGLFCAVASSGTGDRIMTSSNGTSWSTQTNPDDNDWSSICWSPDLGLFCAVATSGTGDRIMTSSNGTSWSTQTNPDDNDWRGVCWSPELGLFCAVAISGTGDRIMTSSNGTSWSTQTSAADNNWYSVCWSPERGLFCAVAISGTGNRAMTSLYFKE